MTGESFFSDIDRYISDLFAPADAVLAAVERSIAEADMPQISVSATEGKLLHVLTRLCDAEKILEIGTLAGYSAIWMARALPPGGRLITIEAMPDYAEVARKNLERAGFSERVTVRTGRALDVLPEIEAEDTSPARASSRRCSPSAGRIG